MIARPHPAWCLALLSLGACVDRLGAEDEVANDSTSAGTDSSSAGTDSTDSTSPGTDSTSTGTDSTSAGTDSTTGAPCATDEDCPVGNCIEGQCQECFTDDDCKFKNCNSAVCLAGACANVDACPIPGCHESWCSNPGFGSGHCVVSLCEMYDDLVDIELRMIGSDYTPSAKLDVGGEIRVMGVASCGEINLVHDIATTELLFMSSLGDDKLPDSEWVRTAFAQLSGSSYAVLTAPLTISYVNHGVCPSMYDVCADTWRTNVDISHEDGPVTRVLDGTIGWAHGGYLVSAHRLETADYPNDCQNSSSSNYDILIARDGCEADCPPATFEAGCVPALDPRPGNFIGVDFEFIANYSWDRWNFQCQVIDAWTEPGEQGELEQIRALDCIALFQPQDAGDQFCNDD